MMGLKWKNKVIVGIKKITLFRLLANFIVGVHGQTMPSKVLNMSNVKYIITFLTALLMTVHRYM